MLLGLLSVVKAVLRGNVLFFVKEQRENRATYYSGDKEKQNKHKK